MAILLDVPVSTINVGTIGPFDAAMPSNVGNNWIVTFTKGASWPASGEVLSAVIEESNNNGSSWRFSASVSFSGGDWRDKSGAIVTQSKWSTTPLFRGINCRIRAVVNVLQSCQAGVRVEA